MPLDLDKALPLTEMEEYIFYNDCPSAPWNGCIRLHFAGSLNSETVRQALLVALKAHPLLSAKIEVKRRKKLFWKFITEPQPEIIWHDVEPDFTYPTLEYINLCNEIGIRLNVVAGKEKSDIIIQFHHACCDGQGISFFVHDFMIAYANHGGEKKFQPLKADTPNLKQRGKIPLIRALKLLPKQIPGFIASFIATRRTLQPISPGDIPERSTERALGAPHSQQLYLDETTVRDYNRAAKAQKVTSNDLLIRDVLTAIGTWKAANHFKESDSWFRLMVPVSLRSRKDYQKPTVANIFSLVMIERQSKALQKRERLLERIKEDMEHVKNLELGYTFIFLLKLYRLLPGGIARVAQNKRFHSSAVLTNLGKQFVRTPLPQTNGELSIGSATLKRIDVLAVYSSSQAASFALIQYAGRSSLSMHYDARRITAEQSKEIIDYIAQQMKKSIQIN